jgi:porphobilinogen synthase
MRFPQVRGRRLRRTETLRQMVRETELAVSDLIYPVFVEPGRGLRRPIPSMPGITNFSVDTLVEEAKEARDLGVPAVILFGIPDAKDEVGSGGTAEDGIVPRAVAALKESVPGLAVITDVCLCEYTSHGHCGVLVRGEVDNDATLPLLAKEALAHVRAGADMVAPSDMMDGRVSAIRTALDGAGFSAVPIMAYAAKYASAFYGPFRDAAQSAPSEGDRRGYQMDPANAREALREVALDVEEGADIIMVKPALSYLDVIHAVRERIDLPVAAYNVSGEYAMIQAAAKAGWLDGQRAMMEVLTSIKRAGADLILTYHAKEAARVLTGAA